MNQEQQVLVLPFQYFDMHRQTPASATKKTGQGPTSTDSILDAVLANSRTNGLPEIAVSATQGKLLKLLAQSIDAKRILEVGTLHVHS